MKRAYVLLSVKMQRIQSVMRMTKRLPYVVRVDAISGRYDIMVTVEAESFDDVNDLIMGHLRGIDGIEHTETWMVMIPDEHV